MATIRLIPSTYSTGSTYVSVSNANNMYTNTDSTNYATATTSRSGNTYVYIKGFNFTDIPSDAIVDSFSIKLKASMSGVSTSTSYRPILCNNTTGISSGSSVLSTSVQTITFTGVSQTWDTIKGYGSNFAIRLNARRSNNNTTSYVYIYGAEIEVDYTIPITVNTYLKYLNEFKLSSKLMIKNSGSWGSIKATNVYEKVSGSWLSGQTTTGVSSYLFGGWIESESTPSTDPYDPSDLPPNSDIIYTKEPGQPNVKTDENGKVTEYTMTEVSEDSPVEINGSDSIDTGYVPFDGQHGFVVDITARFAWSEQDFDETHCTLLNMMKEVSPWPGIVIRYESNVANKLRIVADGNSAHATEIAIPNDSIYSLRITYDLSTVTVYNKLTNTTIDTYSYAFGDISDLTVRIGSSWDPTANRAWRFGVCDVYDFSIKQL